MANKRSLKKAINAVCEELFAECVAASLYGAQGHEDNAHALLYSVVRMRRDFISRVSHPEPGMAAKNYYKLLRERFAAQASDIINHINTL